MAILQLQCQRKKDGHTVIDSAKLIALKGCTQSGTVATEGATGQFRNRAAVQKSFDCVIFERLSFDGHTV